MTSKPYPENRVYKFVDEATGLFWTGGFHAPIFNETGAVEYRTLKNSDDAWRVYEVARSNKPDLKLPILSRVIYEVSITEIERQPFSSTERAMRATRMIETHGRETRLATFIRQLNERDDFMEFMYIVVRDPRAIRKLELDAMPAAVLSSRKTNRKFIAVRSEADLLYLRMLLGESFLRTINLATAKVIYQKQGADE